MVDVVRTKISAADYMQMPESNQITALIEGEIVVAPAPSELHQESAWKTNQALSTKVKAGTIRFAPTDVYLDDETVVQPDVFWSSGDESLCQPNATLQYWKGAPDLVVEVLSPGTARQDRLIKYQLYEQHGVREYWIIDPNERLIEVYIREDARFIRQGIYSDGDAFHSPTVGAAFEVNNLLRG
jgi:Uma2 family endonuclease